MPICRCHVVRQEVLYGADAFDNVGLHEQVGRSVDLILASGVVNVEVCYEVREVWVDQY